jgi:Rv2525c-like, glycoside hydrolase-like domain
VDQAIDYAGARPSPSLIKSKGYLGVLRYVSHSAWKNITPSEFNALIAEGLTVTLNWESSADRMMSGHEGGIADGNAANEQANMLGYPQTCAIYYSFDTDDRGQPGWQDKVAAYLQGAAKTSARPVGVYGSVRVVDEMFNRKACQYFWQCTAWSGKQVSKHAHLYQLVGHTQIDNTDVNNILQHDYGQHPKPTGPPPTPPAQKKAVYDMFLIGTHDPDTDERKYHVLAPDFHQETTAQEYLGLAALGFPHAEDQHPLVFISHAKAMGVWTS